MMLTAHKAIARVLIDELRGRNLSPGERGILRKRLDDDDAAGLLEWVPKLVITALRDDAERHQAAAVADESFEQRAERAAGAMTLDGLRLELRLAKREQAALSSQHEKSLSRMGAGNRPTGAAVAGEAARGALDTIRLLERAIQIKEEAP